MPDYKPLFFTLIPPIFSIMDPSLPTHFIEEIIQKDLAKNPALRIRTRFPPEPNGYLHLGHAKAICVNFSLAKKYGGTTNLRFDDTNPDTEEVRYTEAIKEDIRWLGFHWELEHYASDYFDQLYEWAHVLIEKELAYVDDSTAEEIAAQRGTLEQPGVESPHRNRSVAENKALFIGMKEGQYKEGEKVLRAKINMQAANVQMRDPVLYRIKKNAHPRTGTQWYIYPMYDYAHGQSDSIEGITHSLCSLEYVPHRPLYDWFIKVLGIYPSKQYEFARLNLSHTLMSKRLLLNLIKEGIVRDWDDPRLPTLVALRRRGYTPKAIRNFCESIGIAKRDNLIALSKLEYFVREDLNKKALRRMVVLDPVKLRITNYPEGEETLFNAENNPEDEGAGFRELSFSNELWIEREDFMEAPPKGFHRLSPGQPVRLKYAYIIRFEKAIYEGTVLKEIHGSYVENSRSGMDTSGVKVKATLHWVDAKHAIPLELRLYDRLFTMEDPAKEKKPLRSLANPDSLCILKAYGEAAMASAHPQEHYQFLRKGYFFMDKDSRSDLLIFNRTVSLKAQKW